MHGYEFLLKEHKNKLDIYLELCKKYETPFENDGLLVFVEVCKIDKNDDIKNIFKRVNLIV